jgi:hypothetical protein
MSTPDPLNSPVAGVGDPVSYAELMRKQQLAQLLQQQALSPVAPQNPPPVNGLYVQPRVSPVSGVSRIVEALMAGKNSRDVNKQQAQMMAQTLQQFQPGSSGPVSPPPTVAASPGAANGAPAPSADPLGGYSGGPGPRDVTPQVAQAAQSSAQPNPMNPTGLPAAPLMKLFLTDPSKYLEAIKGTTDWQNALVANGGNVQAARAQMLKAAQAQLLTPEAKNAIFASGGDPDSAAALVHAKLIKDASSETRPGAENMVPTGRFHEDGTPEYRFIRTPNVGQNQDLMRDAQGNPIETHLIPGSAEALRQAHQAEELGKTQGGIHEFVTTGGGSTYYTPPGLTVPGAPGSPEALRPAAPPQPPRYFPPPGGAGAAQGASPTVGQPAPGAASVPVPPGVTPGIWKGAPQRSNAQGIGEDPYVAGTIKKQVEKNEELSNKYGTDADLADQRIAFNNEALKVLGGAEVGPLSDRINQLKQQYHETVGGKLPSWLDVDTNTVNNTTELKKFLLRNPLLSLKPTFGGRPAASEFQVLREEASPSPEMLQGAIQRLVTLDSQSAGFSKQRATDYGYYHDQLKGDPTRFESWYANRVPFAKWLDTHPGGREGEAAIVGNDAPEATGTFGGKTYEKRGGKWLEVPPK